MIELLLIFLVMALVKTKAIFFIAAPSEQILRRSISLSVRSGGHNDSGSFYIIQPAIRCGDKCIVLVSISGLLFL